MSGNQHEEGERVTSPFGDPNQGWNTGPVDYFNNEQASQHLLIFVAHDAPQYFRTQNNPDGMVHPSRGATWAPFPNTVVRGHIADLDVADADGSRGKIYQDAVVFPSSLVKVMRKWPGTGPKLLKWWKTGPKQTDPYDMVNMAGDPTAVAVAEEFLSRHPEFLTLPAPEPYEGKAPEPQGPPVMQGAGYPPQGYGQPAYPGQGQPIYGAGYQAPDPWAQQPQGGGYGYGAPQQQRPPQAPPQQWGQDQGYNQHPPRQPQQWNQQPPAPQGAAPAQGGSFLDRFQQGGSVNHYGQPQSPEPPY